MSRADCEGHGRPYIMALRVRPGEDLAAAMAPYAGAQGILLDTFVEGVPGGTGASFDWSLVPEDAAKPIILAGGLDADNVAAGDSPGASPCRGCQWRGRGQ